MNMIFWASSETDKPASLLIHDLRKRVEQMITELLANSTLSSIEAEIRYVPIVMPPQTAIRYPSRSRLRKKEAVYLCAPQLDYLAFVSSHSNERLKCYIDGIRETAPRLADLGASQEQVQEFLMILDEAYRRLQTS